jgi:ABC-type transport system involved in multi-copper enzyme maturation permease subunit
VNRALVIGLWRQRFASPVRLVILGLVTLMPPFFLLMARGLDLTVLGDAVPITLVLAVGMIGQDVSSGVLQLLLARPVRRWEYVTSRWLSVAIGASAASLLQVGLGCGAMAVRGALPDLGTIAQLVAGREIQIVGLAGTMALFSSLIGGIGDLAIYAILMILGGVLGTIGQFRQSALLIGAGREIGAFVSPHVDLAQIAAGSLSWFTIATWASNLTLCLLLAIVVVNRKELSYADT